MFFRVIDKFFEQLKYAISLIIFVLIGMASLLFIYWLLFSAKIQLPDFINTFVWAVIDFFAQSFKGTKMYTDIVPILPVLASGVFIILTYICNCLMVFLENNHLKFQSCVQTYKHNLEKTINKQLHDSFINDLKKTTYMLVKIKVDIEKHNSYLTSLNDSNVDTSLIEKQIVNSILAAISSDFVIKKGVLGQSAYFLLADFEKSKEFFSNLVARSVRSINENIRPKMNISFYCGAELFDDLSEFNDKSIYVDRLLTLKIPNKIVVTPKFKLLFENIHTDFFSFKVLGEYNLSGDPSKTTYTMIHSLHRRI
ncbi:MAG: hypothetical protein KHX03_08185 [Clostridium sp.]|nr:hypothetical protein [Clostridium sp.]